MRPPEIRLYNEVVADLFAGGGGTSTGIEAALGRSPDVAINHDPEALAMHEANHPTTRHLCESVHDVDPLEATGGKPVGFAWFSPDCTFHSKARGGKPFRDPERARRIRGLAGIVVRWAAKVRPKVWITENVEEFKDWGPIDKRTKRPDPARRGESFRRWVSRLRNLGYTIEWRELVACDYGAPTKRKRLFIVGRCDGKPIRWPVPTHGPRRSKPYRTAAECIDWSLPVPSIFLTPAEAKAWGKAHGQPAPKRPLSENTLARIAHGVRKFVLDAAEPFIVRTDMSQSNAGCVYPATDPLRTVTTAGGFALVAPTLIQTSYGERHGRHGEQAPRVLDIHAPLGTIVAGGIKHSLVAAFLAKHNDGNPSPGQRVLEPLHTVTTKDTKALLTSHLVKLRGPIADHLNASAIPVTEPVPTLSAQGNHIAAVSAFLVKFYGQCAHGQAAQLPLGTVTTRDRFGLVTVFIDGEEYVVVDIGMRMLVPEELYRCTGFPEDYIIDEVMGRRLSKKAQTRMVGNAVPPDLPRALVEANLLEAA